jgi:hypothetical protein
MLKRSFEKRARSTIGKDGDDDAFSRHFRDPVGGGERGAA